MTAAGTSLLVWAILLLRGGGAGGGTLKGSFSSRSVRSMDGDDTSPACGRSFMLNMRHVNVCDRLVCQKLAA